LPLKVYHNSQDRIYAHYAWVKPDDQLRAKVNYYIEQTGRIESDYFDKVFLAFRHDKSVIEKYGSHPFGGGGVARYLGAHPEPIQKRFRKGKYDSFIGRTQ
jgi:hypothetical protein